MKFFEILWKEISLIKGQRVALLLIFIYPFLVIGLVGTAFTGIDVSQMKQNKVGVVNDLAFAPDFTQKFASLNQLTVIDFNDEKGLIDAIKNKEVVAGLRLSGASKFEQIKAELYYDNSSLLASKYFVEIAKAMMQRITADLSQQELGVVWDTISKLAKSVDKENQNILDFKSKLSSAGSSIDKLEHDLNQFDFTEINNALASQQSTIGDFNNENTDFKNQMGSFKKSFDSMKQNIRDLGIQIDSYREDLKTLPAELDAIDANLGDTVNHLIEASDNVTDPQIKEKLNSDINSLESVQKDVQNLKPLSSRLQKTSNELSSTSSDLNVTMARADALFAQVDVQSASISNALGSSSTTISQMNQKLSVFKSSIDEIKSLISESRQSKSDIESKLDASSSILSSFGGQLSDIKDIDPQVLAKPAVFYERKIFNVDPFGILVSNSAVIVLILTCMLLTSILILLEKSQNVSQRLLLSPTSSVTLLAGKIAGQLVIAWIETAIILAVAFAKFQLPFSIGGVSSIGFGLVTQASFVDIFLAVTVIAISFISLGILISFFTKNQSTAILASLLIVVPMLFLSGVILPIEFMEPFMQMISSILPLTVANNILIGLIVKGGTLMSLIVELSALLAFSAIIFFAVLFWKD